MGDDGDRFIICHDPDQAGRDAAIAPRPARRSFIQGTDSLPRPARRAEGTWQADRPGTRSCASPTGLLRIDEARIRPEENLDGKYLLRLPATTCPAEDIALGYKTGSWKSSTAGTT